MCPGSGCWPRNGRWPGNGHSHGAQGGDQPRSQPTRRRAAMQDAHRVSGGAALAAPAVHVTADVDETADLGPGTTVWHLAQIRENARLGSDCIVGRGAYVGPGVVIGDQVKLQNYALVYEPARLEDQVFIGPAVILTNDLFPRSAGVTGKLKRPADWEA